MVESPLLTLAHSPDPDDAFMWWPLGDAVTGRAPEIDTRGLRFTTLAEDIESLNRRAIEVGDLDITAMSAHAYAHAKGKYAITASGASMGDGYGPKLVAKGPIPLDDLRAGRATIAIPGTRTSAYLGLRLMLGESLSTRVVDFEKIIDEVAAGNADAGLVIHEGQLTFGDDGLVEIADLGAWWMERTGLALPLGLNVVRRDLQERLAPSIGPDAIRILAAVLQDCVSHAMAQRERGLTVAMEYGRGISRERTDRFVNLYVNDLTVDMGESGADAVRRFLGEGFRAGLSPDPGEVDVIRPI
jgi:1,4-dihydroxy-6-naphthoate synthase